MPTNLHEKFWRIIQNGKRELITAGIQKTMNNDFLFIAESHNINPNEFPWFPNS